MRDDLELEQLFVRRRGGRVEVLMVFEDPAGGRHRERLPLPDGDPGDAVAVVARLLARRGDVVGAPRLRVREERGGELVDRPAWGRRFRAAFEEAWDEEG